MLRLQISFKTAVKLGFGLAIGKQLGDVVIYTAGKMLNDALSVDPNKETNEKPEEN